MDAPWLYSDLSVPFVKQFENILQKNTRIAAQQNLWLFCTNTHVALGVMRYVILLKWHCLYAFLFRLFNSSFDLTSQEEIGKSAP